MRGIWVTPVSVLLGFGVLAAALSFQMIQDREQRLCQTMREAVDKTFATTFIALYYVSPKVPDTDMNAEAFATVEQIEDLYGRTLKGCKGK